MNLGTINRTGRQMPVHAASPDGAISCHRSASTKKAWGLINRSVPAAEFEAAVEDYVSALVELPPLAVRYTKNATNLLLDMAGLPPGPNPHRLSWSARSKARTSRISLVRSSAPDLAGAWS